MFEKYVLHFVTYGNDAFKKSKERIIREAHESCFFDSIQAFGPKDLGRDFSKKFEAVLNKKKGGGYWIWKFKVILDRLQNMENGEFLIYLDSGCTINKQGASRLLDYLYFADSSPSGALFFQLQGCIEREWTVHQLFEYFDLSLDSHIALSGQCIGTVIIIKKNPNVISLLERCLQVVKDDVFLITDVYTKAGQKTYFKAHRHDQSIFSLVAKLSGAYIIPDETWYVDFSCKEAEKIPFLATRLKK